MPLRMVRRWRGWKRVRRTLYVLVGLALGWYLFNLWQVWRVGESDQARPVDAIIVLGAAQYDGRPAPVLEARLNHVVELYQQGYAPLVVTTGGNQPGDRFTEAEASANYLIDHGVPKGAIVEVVGDTSYDELRAARDVLHGRGLDRVLLVSDPYHMLRVRLVAEELGLTAYVSPTRTSPVGGWTAFELHLKEAAGISLGRLIGFDRLLSITG
ncbi:MAG TPA: YdcF family protein [Ilumatobacteraceae bacterium]|nr:YdcF family protein [Ilumatobacteraceae bacterium]